MFVDVGFCISSRWGCSAASCYLCGVLRFLGIGSRGVFVDVAFLRLVRGVVGLGSVSGSDRCCLPVDGFGLGLENVLLGGVGRGLWVSWVVVSGRVGW